MIFLLKCLFRFFFFILLFFSFIYSEAQSLDTALARQHLDRARVMIDSAKFDEAIQYASSVLEIYNNEKEYKDTLIARAYHQIGVALQYKGQFQESIARHQEALNIRLSILGEAHPLIAESYFGLGETHRQNGAYNKSMQFHEKALAIRLRFFGKKHPVVAESYTSIGTAYLFQGAPEQALDYYQKALEIKIRALGENHPDVATIFGNMGRVYSYQNDYKQALTYDQKALKIRINTLGENHLDVATSYHNIGILYVYLGNYEKGLKNFRKALEIRIAALGETHPDVAQSYHLIGMTYADQDANEEALKYYEKALEIRVNTLREDHPDIAFVYNNIGIANNNLGRYEEALDYFQRALKMDINTFGESHSNIAYIYNNIGIVYEEKGVYEQSLENYQKALKIWKNNFGENHRDVAMVYNNIGVIYKNQGAYEKALEYHRKALKIRLDILGDKHPDVAASYYNTGMVYSAQKAFNQALEYFQKTLKIDKDVYGDNNPYVAEDYNNIGIVYQQQGNYREALQYFQQALQSNSLDFKEKDAGVNPKLTNGALSKITLLESLKQKAKTFLLFYNNQSHELKDLERADRTYQLATQLIDQMRRGYTRADDKIELLKKAFNIYEGSIQTALEFYQQTQQDSFLQQRAFPVFEKSRSILLMENVQKGFAKSFAGVPDTLLDLEQNAAMRLASYEKSIHEEEVKSEYADRQRIDRLQNMLFSLRHSYDSIVSILETQYADYYRLKYDVGAISVERTRRLLDEDQGLIEYFVGDSAIYVFAITPEGFNLKSIKKDFPLEDWVNNLRHGLYGYHLSNNKTEKLYDQCNQLLIDAACKLYDKLIGSLGNLPPKLIIIPDDVLSYIPFEILLTEKPVENHQFKFYSYLGRNHQISYNFSATLWQEMRNKKHTTSGLLAFAPSFPGNETTYPTIAKLRRDGLGALRFNILEVEAIERLQGGKVFAGSEATVVNFKQFAPDYRVLHLATHAKLDDRDADYSFLAFAEQKDSLDNEKLFIRDLYNLRLSADMVVLSACETGVGELQRGEGVISLGRGFTYAGAKSIVTSLWSANDRSTAEIMELLYKNLRAGASKDEALQKAKLTYLDRQSDPLAAHPFYWATFVAIGDMEPLKWQKRFPWGLFLLSLLIIATSGFFWRRKNSVSIQER